MAYREEIDTPALVVHQEIMEANLTQMADYAESHEIGLRPHFKTHKSVDIARKQRELGAIGITCAKLGEAEVLTASGIFDSIFIANQIVGPLKLARLVNLMDQVDVRVAVDSVAVCEGLQEAMLDAGKTLDVVIELNTGQGRAGILSNEAITLAETIRDRFPNLKVIGLMTHEGHAGAATDQAEMEQIAHAAGEMITATAEELRERNFDVQVVSVGSTPAAFTTTEIDGITEMRPGTYVFQDNAIFRFPGYGPENCALRILATVTSRPAPDRAIIDAGSKVLTSDAAKGRSGHGYIVEYPDAEIFSLSEEHGWVHLPEGSQGMQIGEKVEVIPNHVCPTVNLTDELYVVRDGEVAERLPVSARGMVR